MGTPTVETKSVAHTVEDDALSQAIVEGVRKGRWNPR